MKKLNSIKTFLPFTITLGTIVLMIIVGYVFYSDMDGNYQQGVLKMKASVENGTEKSIKAEVSRLSMAADLLLNNEAVLKAFANRDREKLKQMLLPIFENELKPKYGIKQFQFHTPPATSFIRLHKMGGWSHHCLVAEPYCCLPPAEIQHHHGPGHGHGHGEGWKAKAILEHFREEQVDVFISRRFGPNIVHINKFVLPVVFRREGSIDEGLEACRSRFDELAEMLALPPEERKHLVIS